MKADYEETDIKAGDEFQVLIVDQTDTDLEQGLTTQAPFSGALTQRTPPNSRPESPKHKAAPSPYIIPAFDNSITTTSTESPNQLGFVVITHEDLIKTSDQTGNTSPTSPKFT